MSSHYLPYLPSDRFARVLSTENCASFLLSSIQTNDQPTVGSSYSFVCISHSTTNTAAVSATWTQHLCKPHQCHTFRCLLPALLAAGFGPCPAIIRQVIHTQPGQTKQLEAGFVILQYSLRNGRGMVDSLYLDQAVMWVLFARNLTDINELKKPLNSENDAVRTHWLGALYWAFRNPSDWHTAGKQRFFTGEAAQYCIKLVIMKVFRCFSTDGVYWSANCAQQSGEQYCQLCATDQWTVLPTCATEQWITLSTVRNTAMNNIANCAQHSNE